jgi:hypothetical protein
MDETGLVMDETAHFIDETAHFIDENVLELWMKSALHGRSDQSYGN